MSYSNVFIPSILLEDVNSLLEQFSAKDVSAANRTILQYLERKLGKLVKMPGVEHYKNSVDSGFGLRFFVKGTKKCFRLNWKSANVNEPNGIKSVDIWEGNQKDPNMHIDTAGVSIVKILPTIVELINKPQYGTIEVYASSTLAEELVAEAKLTTGQAVHMCISFIQSNQTFGKVALGAVIGHSKFNTFIDALEQLGAVSKAGTKYKVDKVPTEQQLASIVDKNTIKITVKPGGHNDGSPVAQEAELQARVPYDDQLKHLETLTKSVIKGAFNALFIAGPGGTGKTYTVEKVLEAAGMSDGEGYFKNTGSASAIGIYSLLWRHRKDIILFDDCDSALADQEARNLIKAATDTKKVRKLAWNKKGSKFYNPADYGDEDDGPEDEDALPQYYNFEGRVIFISNLPLQKLDPDGALRTRAFVIEISPTNDELYSHMEKIIDDIKLEDGLTMSTAERKKVFGLVKESSKQQGVSIRKVVKALNLAAAGVTEDESMLKDLIKLYCH